MKNGPYYDYATKTVSYYKDEEIIASLDIDKHKLDTFIEIEESDKCIYYEELVKEYEEYQQAKEDNERYNEH